MISIADFEKIDIRIGTVMAVDEFPQAKKPSLQLTIDFGSLGIKKSSAQLTALYSKESLLNRQVIAVVNLPVLQIANFFSECLVLGVVSDDKTVVLLQPERTTANGLKIA